jgi:hypothetical protein
MEFGNLIEQFPEELHTPITALLERFEEGLAFAVTKDDFHRLEALIERQSEHISELAEAQTRTEKLVGELVQAQARTDERLAGLTVVVAGLAEAQARTEKRVEELAQAQARTEKRLEELAEAQARTEKRLEELAEAQARTEKNLAALTQRVDDLTVEVRSIRRDLNRTREDVGGLAHTVGHRLEDEAMRALPALLARDHGITVQGRLKRDYMQIGSRKPIEVNLWGAGVKDGRPVEIIGEAKSRLVKSHVDALLKDVALIRPHVGRDIVPVMVAYLTTPQVRAYMQEKGVIYYWSYEL